MEERRECPVCCGDMEELGRLAYRSWFRCVHCGITTSTALDGSKPAVGVVAGAISGGEMDDETWLARQVEELVKKYNERISRTKRRMTYMTVTAKYGKVTVRPAYSDESLARKLREQRQARGKTAYALFLKGTSISEVARQLGVSLTTATSYRDGLLVQQAAQQRRAIAKRVSERMKPVRDDFFSVINEPWED